MEITDIRIRMVDTEGKLKAYVTLTFDGCFVVHNLKIISGQAGTFVAMPSRKTKNGEYKDIAHPINSDFRNTLQSKILEEYNKLGGQEEREEETAEEKEETPEMTETKSQEASETPEEKAETPEMTETTSQETSEAPEEKEETPEMTETISQETSEAPEEKEETPEITETISQETSEAPEEKKESEQED